MKFKDILAQISLTTLLLIFLFFCGTLYIISYWSTFKFDITSYIELLDIPKSFVFPLATSLGVAFLSMLAQAVLYSAQLEKSPEPHIINRKIQIKFTWFRINSNFAVFSILIICMIFYDPHSEWIVIIAGTSLIGWGHRKLNNSTQFAELLPYKQLRLFCSILITFIPVYSVCKGKLDGLAVWKNRTYYSINAIEYSEPSFNKAEVVGNKLLGKIGNCIVVTDSGNSKIVVLNVDKAQKVIYTLHESKSLIGE